MINKEFEAAALGLVPGSGIMGCEGDDLGTPKRPSIWLFGIEQGDPKKPTTVDVDAQGYSISQQMQYPFNRNAFRMLSVICGSKSDEFEKFATERQPFVTGKQGFFKGNLFPLPCNKVSSWPKEAIRFTGFETKNEMREWSRKARFAKFRYLMAKHQPRLLICAGIGALADFCLAFGIDPETLNEVHFEGMNGLRRRYYHGKKESTTFVVIPHLSPSGPHCLSNPIDIEYLGWKIEALLNP
tara:strand:+ start:436 stop:1158 length:723 start_codon:yes stop_codon:yes gene_type:complete